jgi:predicted SAM-dependent methyltransferase
MNLNVGSGQRRFGPGWINIDLQVKKPEIIPDVQAQGEQLPVPSEVADFVVLHHVLEHYGCGEGESVIKECWRCLKTGGSLLVFVPNTRALAQRYLIRQMDTQLYMTNTYGAFHGHDADRHRWGFDNDSLRYFLGTVTGCVAKTFDWREVPGADLAKDWWILAMECEK